MTISPFIEVTKEKFIDMTEWLFISKNSHSIIHIQANEEIYKILNKLRDPKTRDDVYLVPDVLCNFSFDIFDENDYINNNFEDITKIGEADLTNSDDLIVIIAKTLAPLPKRKK